MLQSFMKRTHLFFKKESDQKGSVLIEFAFCCPVLIIVLLFVLDVPLAYRVLVKMQKMSELTASMIRSVPAKDNTLISLEDLKNISKAAGITLTGRLGSPGNPCKRYPFYLSTYVFCVEGNSKGGFEKKWTVHIKNNLYNGEIISDSDVSLIYSKFKDVSDFKTIKEFSNYTIHEGEVKLIVETVAWYNKDISANQEGISADSNGGLSSKMLGDYNGNKRRVRGFNKGFYLMTIPGRDVSKSTGEKAFGNRYAIMSCVDEIVDPENCPE